MNKLIDGLKLYRDPRMLLMLALGFSSGLPRLLVYSTLTFWLLEEGLSIKAVGLFAATATPYSLKFLWAPLVDAMPLGPLSKRLGQRRAWMLLTQLGLAAAIAALATTSPSVDIFATAIAAIVVAAFSATQDIVVDAYRVDLLEVDEQGAGAAAVVFGYRIAMLVASAGALYLSALSGDNWQLTYFVMAALMGVGVAATLLGPEPDRHATTVGKSVFRTAVIEPLADITRRPGWSAILAFIILFKLGDALAGVMTTPLLLDVGFDKIEIANIVKTFGFFATMIGVFYGGALVSSLGVVRALWVAGFLQMGSNLMFALQAYVGYDLWLLTATISIENLTGGLGTAAFVAYLSGLCNKQYSATQYALLTALSSWLRTLLSTSSGFIADETGWVFYFLLTTASAIPGLIVLYMLQRRNWTGLRSEPQKPT